MNTDRNMERRKAYDEFWATYDCLVAEGVTNVKQHPDYIAADKRCLKASKTLAEEESKGTD